METPKTLGTGGSTSPRSLYEVYDLVERIARSVPNVNTFTETFESLNAEDTEYSAVVLQFRDGTQPSDGFVRYRFYLGYADRVNDQGSDKIKIQSVAEQALRTIINKVNQDVEIEYGTFTPFEQRFTALTTGGYVECSCTLAVSDCNYETGSVLRNGKVTITENGTTTVVPTAGVDGFKQVEVTTDVHELFYDLDGTKYRGSYISEFPDNFRLGPRYDHYFDEFEEVISGTESMFRDCIYLTKVPSFDTSHCSNFSYMFCGAEKLIEVPSMDLNKAKLTHEMFKDCRSITDVELDMPNVYEASYMFQNCYNLKHVKINTDNLIYGDYLFYNCRSLESIEPFNNSISRWNYVFSGCTSLKSLENHKITVEEGGVYMFQNCKSLETLPMIWCYMSSVYGLLGMFDGCTNLVNFGGLSGVNVKFDLSPCTKLSHESLLNVINNLENVTSSTTLTLGSTNLAKLTDEEKAIATGKGWTLV